MTKTALTAAFAFTALLSAENKKEDFSNFIAPVSNPVYFESALHTTELRAIYINQDLHNQVSTALGPATNLGGDLQMGALQIRYAINDKLSIIATKDGYAKIDYKNSLADKSGFADLALGVKYSPYQDVEDQEIFTTGLRFEIPTGDEDVLQGNHDGIANPFLAYAKGWDNVHLQAYQGLQVPFSSSSSLESHTSLHLDYQIGDFYPLVEVNWRHTIDGGNGGNAKVEIPGVGTLPTNTVNNSISGGDISNLGSAGSTGNNDLTYAVGFRYKFNENVTFGAAYESEVTDAKEGLFDKRVTCDLIYQF